VARWQSRGTSQELAEWAITAGMSRAQFVRRGAVAVGALAGLGLLKTRAALGSSGFDPKPIPGGFDENFNIVPSGAFIHVLPPAIGFEMATITDFDGVIAAGEIQGTARGTDGTQYTFDTDMRFMRGRYIGMDGRLRDGSFAFV
jgi:hypothetical protein